MARNPRQGMIASALEVGSWMEVKMMSGGREPSTKDGMLPFVETSATFDTVKSALYDCNTTGGTGGTGAFWAVATRTSPRKTATTRRMEDNDFMASARRTTNENCQQKQAPKGLEFFFLDHEKTKRESEAKKEEKMKECERTEREERRE